MCWGVVPGAGGVRRGADRRRGDTPALQRSAAGFRAPFRAGGGLPPRVGGRDGGGLWRGLRAGRRSGLRSPRPRPSRGHPPGERLAVLAEYREQRGRPSRKCVRTPLFRGGRQDAVRVRDHAAPSQLSFAQARRGPQRPGQQPPRRNPAAGPWTLVIFPSPGAARLAPPLTRRFAPRSPVRSRLSPTSAFLNSGSGNTRFPRGEGSAPLPLREKAAPRSGVG